MILSKRKVRLTRFFKKKEGQRVPFEPLLRYEWLRELKI